MEKKILLIAFKYPPYTGVGGFRWSKLSKYLAEMGYKIHVVTVNWKQYGDNTYINDVQHSNIIIHRIPSLYPHNLKYKPFEHNRIGNFKRTLRYLFFKIINVIWYEDEAQFWGYNLLPFCNQLIKLENIQNVIATGHPFMSNYWAAKLKQKNPEINLIQDFRDEWNDDPNRSLPSKQMNKISAKHELFALNHCDVLFAVTKGLLNIFSTKINNDIRKVVISNGFDTCSNQKTKINHNFKFIHAGNLFSGREEPLEAFISAIDKINMKIPELTVDFYGSFPLNLKKKYDHLFQIGVLKHSPPVSPEKIQELMRDSFVCLQFNARIYSYLVSTKIYEYASLRRPTLSINYGGEIDDLVRKHKLGISVNGDNPEQIENEILNLYDIWKQDPSYEISPEGIEKFHYRNLAKDVARYLK